ncbi:hypothetical protein P171DRAFT_263857 [Karstenula rhodostoma CBS 690.94]|uniref:Uncharacterized protein n=1 Tax=Karstenula rhodostoma CBS 690.94 TaxID=1392251 RepID=A0A9P4PJI7_9PLEO|nr:hypothetical protein P171DRAFT_263857 [Karstenula rhodostoma CBS 690.94]
MSATTSIFPQLPRELRDMIWQAAATVQFEQIADRQLKSCMSQDAYAERLRQAFIGYDSLPEGTERQPLRVYVYDSGDKLKLGINEFQTLVNAFPIAAVCTEARFQIVNFCRAQIGLVDLFCYHADAPPNELSDFGQELSEPVFNQPMAVVITNSYDKDEGPGAFKSAAHLVNILHRVFGNAVERIIMRGWFRSFRTMEELYWPNAAHLETLRYMHALTSDQNKEKCAIFMTPERTAYSTVKHLDPKGFKTQYITWHLLKFHEIMDASTHKLPRLQNIEAEQYTYSWDKVFPTRIKATKQDDGILWVDWSDVQIRFHHSFAGFDGYPEGWKVDTSV